MAVTVDPARRAPTALLFDVQGTATDFHSTVCSEARRISDGRYPEVDWAQFVNDWRAAYFSFLGAAKPAQKHWTSVHSLIRDGLESLLAEHGITDLSAAEREELTLAWQRLEPWPDAVLGLTRLKKKFTLAALSNADVSAVISISKHGGLPWDAVFAAEMAGAFKPDPAVYQMAARYLGLAPPEIMMVASHKYDIRAAASLRFQTAFVARPLELGPNGIADTAYDDAFDVNAADFLDLATQLDS
jgi:2-haloacid dehalogenase